MSDRRPATWKAFLESERAFERKIAADRAEVLRRAREHDLAEPPPPPYSGLCSCPKCASTAVETVFCTDWWTPLILRDPPRRGCRYHAHMHRDCARCGHGWVEAPLDGYGTARKHRP